MKKQRLKKGEYIAMSPEERLAHKHFLQKRWRENHPDWVKKSNKYWNDVYNDKKPYTCICKYCGEEFGARRAYYKKCPKCIQLSHDNQKQKKQEHNERLEKRKIFIDTVIGLYEAGATQQYIADMFHRTQSGIAAILRRHKKSVDKTKRK